MIETETEFTAGETPHAVYRLYEAERWLAQYKPERTGER